MADSYVEYNGDGAETDFTITFNYLSQTVVLPPSTPAGIKVYVSDVQQTSGYTLTGSDIVFTTAPASGTNNVVIKRVTPRGHSDRLVDFTAGATLSESDLETSQLQNLYIAQEAWEQGSEDSVVTTSTTSIDAGSITATELAPDSVGSSELADAPDGVRLANMGDDSVGTAQIVDDSITFAKLKETDFVTGSFTAATDTFLRFDKDSGNIVNPLLPASQVKSADISDFHAAVKTNRLDQMAEPTAAVDMSLEKITNLATPVAATDAATKGYVDGELDNVKYVKFSGSGSFTVELHSSVRGHLTVLTGTLPSDIDVITRVGWSVNCISESNTLTDNDDADVDAHIFFTDNSNTIISDWASTAGHQYQTNSGAATLAAAGNTIDGFHYVLNGTSLTTFPNLQTRYVDMHQPKGSLSSIIMTFIYGNRTASIDDADDQLVVTVADVEIMLSYIPS